MPAVEVSLEEANKIYSEEKKRVEGRGAVAQVPAGFVLKGDELITDDSEPGINFQSPGYKPFPSAQMGG